MHKFEENSILCSAKYWHNVLSFHEFLLLLIYLFVFSPGRYTSNLFFWLYKLKFPSLLSFFNHLKFTTVTFLWSSSCSAAVLCISILVIQHTSSIDIFISLWIDKFNYLSKNKSFGENRSYGIWCTYLNHYVFKPK